MKKFLVTLGALLLGASACVAQTTAVTATVVDSDTTVWANAPWTLAFKVGPSQSNPAAYSIGGVALDKTVAYQTGVADGSGVITFTTYRSGSVSPIGSSWNLTVCPNASSKCSTINFTTTGSSQDISTQVNAAILAPRFQAVSGSYGYADTEAILQLKPGSTYYNVVSGPRCYNGSLWVSCGGGSAGPYAAVADASPIAWNLTTAPNGIVTLAHTTGTRALNITGVTNGNAYTLLINEDSTGGAALTGGSGCVWKISGGVGNNTFPILTSPSAYNILSFSYDGTNCIAYVTAMTTM